jgi:malate dehydrogenase
MISIIGAGRVGSTIAMQLVLREIDDVHLLDIVDGLAKGQALDLSQLASGCESDIKISGSSEYESLRGSDLVIVPAGFARTPNMTRLDLLSKNQEIVKYAAERIKEFAPSSIIIMVTNPVDVMTYLALKITGFPRERVFGMGGLLDSLRFKSIISSILGVSNGSLDTPVIGEHGENMLPLDRFSSSNGIPVRDLIPQQRLDDALTETRRSAAQIISLKGATTFAPSQAVATMVEAVISDKKSMIPTSVFLEGEYGVNGICMGVPAILGSSGVERIIEIDLDENERHQFTKGKDSLTRVIEEMVV